MEHSPLLDATKKGQTSARRSYTMILGRSNFGVKLVNLPVLSDGCRKYHELYYAKKHKPVLSTGQQDFMVG